MSASRGLGHRLSMDRRLAVASIAVVACFVRLAHVLAYERFLASDESNYVDIAAHRLTWERLFRPEGLFIFPPGYPLFLKPFLLALEELSALRAVQIAQAILGAWSCVLIYRLAARVHTHAERVWSR